MNRETNSSTDQLNARLRLQEMFEQSPIPIEDRMSNLGLFIRGSCLVKILVLNDLYLRIKDLPGSIVEFGTWYGQNLVLFENLRAIYEPFNKTRQIVGFDTFTGYSGYSAKDAPGSVITAGNYAALADWKHRLVDLLEVHEANNVIGHMRGLHSIVEGDVSKSAPKYFAEHPDVSVALAYFDMGLYEPTKAALNAIRPHLLPGSVLLFDEFSWAEAKGEAMAFREIFGTSGYRIEKSSFTPMRAIVTIT